MRHFPRVLLLLSAIGTSPAWCADHLLSVTATVSPTCKFTDVPVHIGFPEIDPSDTQTFVVSSIVRARCTNGTRLNVSIGGATQSPAIRQLESWTFINQRLTRMSYRLDWTITPEPTGGFSDSAQDFVITLTGTLTPAQYQDAEAGQYEDAVTVQLTP